MPFASEIVAASFVLELGTQQERKARAVLFDPGPLTLPSPSPKGHEFTCAERLRSDAAEEKSFLETDTLFMVPLPHPSQFSEGGKHEIQNVHTNSKGRLAPPRAHHRRTRHHPLREGHPFDSFQLRCQSLRAGFFSCAVNPDIRRRRGLTGRSIRNTDPQRLKPLSLRSTARLQAVPSQITIEFPCAPVSLW